MAVSIEPAGRSRKVAHAAARARAAGVVPRPRVAAAAGSGRRYGVAYTLLNQAPPHVSPGAASHGVLQFDEATAWYASAFPA